MPGLVLSCEHASWMLPPGVDLGVPLDILQGQASWDHGALEIAQQLADEIGLPVHAGASVSSCGFTETPYTTGLRVVSLVVSTARTCGASGAPMLTSNGWRTRATGQFMSWSHSSSCGSCSMSRALVMPMSSFWFSLGPFSFSSSFKAVMVVCSTLN